MNNNGQKIKFSLGGLRFSSVCFFLDSAKKNFFPVKHILAFYDLDLLSVVIIEITRHM